MTGRFMKKIITICLVILMMANTVFASEWKKIKENKSLNNQVEAWYNPTFTKCSDKYVLYAMRFKSKAIGDYINIICTDTRTRETAIMGTYLYDKNFVPDYPDTRGYIKDMTSLNNNCILYPIMLQACNDYSTKVKTGKLDMTIKQKQTKENIVVVICS
jgi:hypothetical protein